ncbi:hypothetical protein, partial [Rheinheimera tilapiae]
ASFYRLFFTFQTHPAFCVSLHPVGMARIIGRFKSRASSSRRKIEKNEPFADFSDDPFILHAIKPR